VRDTVRARSGGHALLRIGTAVGEGSNSGLDEDRNAEERASEDEQVIVRRAKLAKVRESGNPFPNDFRRDAFCGDLASAFADVGEEALEKRGKIDALAGRVKAIRSFGKTLFLVIEDVTGCLQLYIRKDDVERWSSTPPRRSTWVT